MVSKYYKDDGDKKNEKKSNRGLKTAINPVLLSSNLNLVSKQYKNENPYLSESNRHGANSKVAKRYQRGLKFHDKGEVTAQIEKERQEQRDELQRRREKEHIEQLRRKRENDEIKVKILNGELPDESIGEGKYIKKPEDVPNVEWWDKIYLDERMQIRDKYLKDESTDDDSDDEESHGPSIRYVVHPVPVKVETSRYLAAKVYLTKDEQKKMRRNNRKLLRQEKETRIKLGLDPKPKPKVKLSNMMSVYENDSNIVDPTKWEQTVKQEVEQRKQKHLEENSKRHDEAVENRRTIEVCKGPDDTFCQVFWFKNLTNPKIRYKLKMNSQQLYLKGACLRIGEQGSGVIIIVGKEKSCRFYNKLVTKRIKWDEDFEDLNTGETVKMDGNYSELVWEGYSSDLKFPNWFMKVCEDENELSRTLAQYNALSFISTFRKP